MAKFKLTKLQVPKEFTNKFLTKVYTAKFLNQVIVDPQSPKEQARIQKHINDLEDFQSRLVDMSYRLKISDYSLQDIKAEDYEKLYDYEKLSNEIISFLDEFENIVSSDYDKLQKLKKEERILSALFLLQGETEKNDFSIDLLASGSRTFTVLGEIPSSYEELIRFYLTEITAGKLFFWSSKTEDKEKQIVLCISLMNYKEQVEEILIENHFNSTEFDLSILNFLENTKEKSSIGVLYSSTTKDISSLEGKIEDLSLKTKKQILHLLSLIDVSLSTLDMEEKGRTDEKNFTFWGWLRSKNQSLFESEINILDFTVKLDFLEDVPFQQKKDKTDVHKEQLEPSEELIEKEIEIQVPHLPHRGRDVKGGILFPKKASFVRLEAPSKETRKFVSFIHSLNSVQPIKIGSQSEEVAEKLNSQRIQLNQYLANIRKLQDMLEIEDLNEIDTKFQIPDGFKHSKAFIENFLRDNEKKITDMVKEYRSVKRKQEQVELYLPFEKEFSEQGVEIDMIEGGFQTVTHLGSIPKNHFKAVKFFLNEVTDGTLLFWSSDSADSKRNEKNILVLSMQDYNTAISRVLNEYSFRTLEFDQSILQEKESLSKLQDELAIQLEKIEDEISQIKETVTDKLVASNELILTELERINTEELCQTSEGKITMWGWIPSDGMKNLKKLKDELDFGIEITPTEDVPLVNPSITKKGKVFKSIRGLVGGIGEPNPHEIDPYSIIRFTFPFLFGIMFADVGHGLMLTLIGAFLAFRKRRKKIKPDESITGYLYSGAELLIFCGLSATIFGFFFGSILGDEKLIPNLMHQIGIDWIPLINPLHDTQIFLTFSLAIGFIMMQFGIWLKFVQNVKYGHGFAAKIAPVVLSIFYVGIFAVLYTIIGANVESQVHEGLIQVGFKLPEIPGMTYIVIVTIALIPVIFIVEYLHAKTDGIMDAIDHIIALFSNTLSFSRLMALLLVHAILSGIPFTLLGYNLAEVSPLSLSAANWVIGIIFGLVLIVPLEGLLSFLNSLRLHWVEWFSKFYVGDGKPYTPLTEQLKFIEFVPTKGN